MLWTSGQGYEQHNIPNHMNHYKPIAKNPTLGPSHWLLLSNDCSPQERAKFSPANTGPCCNNRRNGWSGPLKYDILYNKTKQLIESIIIVSCNPISRTWTNAPLVNIPWYQHVSASLPFWHVQHDITTISKIVSLFVFLCYFCALFKVKMN